MAKKQTKKLTKGKRLSAQKPLSTNSSLPIGDGGITIVKMGPPPRLAANHNEMALRG